MAPLHGCAGRFTAKNCAFSARAVTTSHPVSGLRATADAGRKAHRYDGWQQLSTLVDGRLVDRRARAPSPLWLDRLAARLSRARVGSRSSHAASPGQVPLPHPTPLHSTRRPFPRSPLPPHRAAEGARCRAAAPRRGCRRSSGRATTSTGGRRTPPPTTPC
jgi:hypothetical protein